LHNWDALWFTSLHDLYHYFLLDVELEGCARTSRVVAATASVQLYVHRVLMNLEQDPQGQVQVRVNPDAMQEWKWRKNYRVWEANRKVFLYPENYLEPDLRDNKTPLFEELESELLQQEITKENVLEAYTRYINTFEEVSSLIIAGVYHDIDKKNEQDILHIFGVTSTDPITYYYRSVENIFHGRNKNNNNIVWHPWEKINVSIPVRKISPVIFKNKFYIFWTVINTQPQNSQIENGSSSFVGYKHSMNLNFSTLKVDNSWSCPQSISLDDQNLFTQGNGVIEDFLRSSSRDDFSYSNVNEENSVGLSQLVGSRTRLESKDTYHSITNPGAPESKELLIPKYKPQDGYTLKGFQWNNIYPEVLGDTLRIVARNFRMNSEIDLYNKRIKNNFNLPQTFSLTKGWDLWMSRQSPMSLHQTKVVSGIALLSLNRKNVSWLPPFAYSSLLLQEPSCISEVARIWENESSPSCFGDNGNSLVNSTIRIFRYSLEEKVIEKNIFESNFWAVRSSLGNQSSPKKRTFLRQLSPECSTLADIVSISQVHYGVMPALGANPL
jgi:hypothetical protein